MPSKRQIFFPYRFAGEVLDLKVVAVELDNKPTATLVGGTTVVDLQHHPNWTNCSFRLEVGIDQRATADLLPPDEQNGPPWRVVVAVTSAATRWRQGFTLQPVGSETSKWVGTLQFCRSAVAGSLTLQAFLVRSSPRQGPATPYAVRTGARLASSVPWLVHIDPPKVPPGKMLDVRWEDFAQSTNQRLASRSSNVYYLDLQGAMPILWLNRRVPDMEPVLNSAATSGEKATIRNTLFDSIAQAVWMSLVLDSTYSIPDDATEPAEDWQKAVFDQFAPAIFPGSSEDLAKEQLLQMVRDPSQTANLAEMLPSIIQARLDLAKSTKALLTRWGGEGA